MNFDFVVFESVVGIVEDVGEFVGYFYWLIEFDCWYFDVVMFVLDGFVV